MAGGPAVGVLMSQLEQDIKADNARRWLTMQQSLTAVKHERDALRRRCNQLEVLMRANGLTPPPACHVDESGGAA